MVKKKTSKSSKKKPVAKSIAKKSPKAAGETLAAAAGPCVTNGGRWISRINGMDDGFFRVFNDGQRAGNLSSMSGSTTSFPDVVSQIGSNHPLACRIGWTDGGGHFVIVHGYSDGANGSWVTVEDPFFGPSTYVYSVFCTSYRNSGKWTHSYFTQP